jgi:hypothetical protein
MCVRSLSGRHQNRAAHAHLVEVRGDRVEVDEARDVLVVRKVPEERDLAERALRERDLVEHARDLLDRDGLARDLVERGAARACMSVCGVRVCVRRGRT